ncbi:MAG TPA: hypothetical protein VFB95_09995 [Candidatus Cryosericum sp.]|nr:hypothetical protein [Candidatus Cryosericum sp.]
MRNILSMIVAGGCLFMAVGPGPQAREASRPATIGEFAVRVSAALGYEDPVPDSAASNLKRRGVELGADLGTTLTEGRAAKVMADLGLPVVPPAHPSAPVTESRAGILAATIGTTLSTAAPGAEGIGFAAELPTFLQCLQAPNTGLCIQCCVDALPPRLAMGAKSRLCSHVCMFASPQPSLSSPPD